MFRLFYSNAKAIAKSAAREPVASCWGRAEAGLLVVVALGLEVADAESVAAALADVAELDAESLESSELSEDVALAEPHFWFSLHLF